MLDLKWLWDLIEKIEAQERRNSEPFSGILHEARCAERMKAWEKVINRFILEDIF